MGKWDPQEGQYRIVARGDLGIHQGKPLWDFKAARSRYEKMLGRFTDLWVEKFINGEWMRVPPP